MSSAEIDLQAALKQYFGFSQFKGLQEKVIKNIINADWWRKVSLLPITSAS